ncbi:MAG: hypothetical protein C4547_04715 [Phycisphaerales bacterium]|nr:MAG: hypothetical protein C4547_04715 [Phycisphaerales bacterium]
MAEALGLAVLAAGCERNVRLADKTVPTVTVRPVTHYGVALDEDATPEDVAYVLLRALRDDVNAASDEDRRRALDVQFDLAAPNAITSALRHQRLTRDEAIYQVVTHWAPIVAYYVDNFDFDLATARQQLAATPSHVGTDGQTVCAVVVPLADPGGDERAAVFLEIMLAREKAGDRGAAGSSNGKEFWRVVQLQFETRRRPPQAALPLLPHSLTP